MPRRRRTWLRRGVMASAWPILREMAPTAFRRAINAVGEGFWQAGTVGAIAAQNRRNNLNSFSSQSVMPSTPRMVYRTGRSPRTPARNRPPVSPPRTVRRKRPKKLKNKVYTGPGKSGGTIGKSSSYTKGKVKSQTMKFDRGTMYQRETAFTATGQEVVVVGHATFPEVSVQRVIGQMIVKYMFAGMKVKCEGDFTFNLITNLLFSSGDVFTISFRNNTDGTTTTNIALTISAASTVASLIDAYSEQIKSIYTNDNLEAIDLSYKPNTGSTYHQAYQVNISGATFHLYSKSTLKVQNQSVIGTDTTTDAVDSVPLHGRYYECKGTALLPRKAQSSLCATRVSGCIVAGFSRNSTNNDFREPPPPSYFKSITGSGKEKLDPGELKTSTLISKESTKISKLHKYFVVNDVSTSYTRGGIVRAFAFERMLDNLVAAENMTLAVEVDLKVGCVMENKYKDYWAPFNDTKLFI